MAKPGFEELKRVFGDVVTDKGESYFIHFPTELKGDRNDFDPGDDEPPRYRASRQTFDAGHGYNDGAEYHDHGYDDDDDEDERHEGGAVAGGSRWSNRRPPHEQAKRALLALRALPTNEIGAYVKDNLGVVEISKYAAEQPRFIEALRELEDGHFQQLTEGANAEMPTDKIVKNLPQRVIAKLNEVNPNTKWRIGEDANGKLIYMTNTPVANAQGAVYILTEALGIPISAITLPPKGELAAAIPLALITEENEGKLNNINARTLAPMLEARGTKIGGPK